MKIRPAGINDAPLLAKIHVDSWQAAYRGLVPDTFRKIFTYRWREKSFRQSLTTGKEETYMIQVEKEIVGFLTLGNVRDSDLDAARIAEIWGIYILPGYWRKGLGKRLAKKAESILKSRGYQEAVLWVLEGNQPARQFYQAMGFQLNGKTKVVEWGRPLKAVRYRKKLHTAG